MASLIISTIHILFQLIDLLLFIRIILSWLPVGSNLFTTTIYNLTEPLLYPFRELLKKSPLGKGIMVDFSPIFLVLILSVIESVLTRIISTIL